MMDGAKITSTQPNVFPFSHPVPQSRPLLDDALFDLNSRCCSKPHSESVNSAISANGKLISAAQALIDTKYSKVQGPISTVHVSDSRPSSMKRHISSEAWRLEGSSTWHASSSSRGPSARIEDIRNPLICDASSASSWEIPEEHENPSNPRSISPQRHTTSNMTAHMAPSIRDCLGPACDSTRPQLSLFSCGVAPSAIHATDTKMQQLLDTLSLIGRMQRLEAIAKLTLPLQGDTSTLIAASNSSALPVMLCNGKSSLQHILNVVPLRTEGKRARPEQDEDSTQPAKRVC